MIPVAVYFSHFIDCETHPEISTKKDAIAVIKSQTTNKISNVVWEAEGQGWTLFFTEQVVVNVPDDVECLSYCEAVQNAKPQILGGECTTARRLKH